MNEQSTSLFQKQENNYSDFFLSEDEVSYLEIDVLELGFDFDSNISLIESSEDDVVAVQFFKKLNSPLELLFVKSLDLDLFKDNIINEFGDYDIDVEFIVVKKIGNKIKEYHFSVTFFKNKQLWEEYDG